MLKIYEFRTPVRPQNRIICYQNFLKRPTCLKFFIVLIRNLRKSVVKTSVFIAVVRYINPIISESREVVQKGYRKNIFLGTVYAVVRRVAAGENCLLPADFLVGEYIGVA